MGNCLEHSKCLGHMAGSLRIVLPLWLSHLKQQSQIVPISDLGGGGLAMDFLTLWEPDSSCVGDEPPKVPSNADDRECALEAGDERCCKKARVCEPEPVLFATSATPTTWVRRIQYVFSQILPQKTLSDAIDILHVETLCSGMGTPCLGVQAKRFLHSNAGVRFTGKREDSEETQRELHLSIKRG